MIRIIAGIELTGELRNILGAVGICYPWEQTHVEMVELLIWLGDETKRVVNTPNIPHSEWVKLESVLIRLFGHIKESKFRSFLREL